MADTDDDTLRDRIAQLEQEVKDLRRELEDALRTVQSHQEHIDKFGGAFPQIPEEETL